MVRRTKKKEDRDFVWAKEIIVDLATIRLIKRLLKDKQQVIVTKNMLERLEGKILKEYL